MKRKKTHTPHPRHHARHPQLAFSLEHSIRINFPFFFLLKEEIFFFFFPVAFSFFIFDDFSEIRPTSSVEYTAPADQPPTKLFYALHVVHATVNYGWTESYQRKGNVSSPFEPFFFYVVRRTTTEHAVVYYSRNPII